MSKAFALLALGAGAFLVYLEWPTPPPPSVRVEPAESRPAVMPPPRLAPPQTVMDASSSEPALRREAAPVGAAPADLPDFEALRRIDDDLAQEWSRTRADVLAERFGDTPELSDVISALDHRSAAYRASKSQLVQNLGPGLSIASPEVLDRLAKLQGEYRGDVAALVGDTTFSRLEDERQRIDALYAAGGYRIPHDFY